MKKLLYILAAAGLLMGAISCSSDDEPKRGDGVFTVNTPMINHLYNTLTGEVMGMSSTTNKLTMDTTKHTAALELRYNDGTGEKTLKLDDLKATPKWFRFYELTSPSNASFSGYVDINYSSMRYRYTTADGIRVISTMTGVFYNCTENTITYDDTTAATELDNVKYEFTLIPATGTAIVKVADIFHAKDWISFTTITATSVPVTVTPNGYSFAGENLTTTARYYAHMDSTGKHDETTKTTNKYPFKTFNATADLANDRLEANFMMGSSATVTATGKTYSDNNSH